MINHYLEINQQIQTHIQQFVESRAEASPVREWIDALENTFITRPYERSCR